MKKKIIFALILTLLLLNSPVNAELPDVTLTIDETATDYVTLIWIYSSEEPTCQNTDGCIQTEQKICSPNDGDDKYKTCGDYNNDGCFELGNNLENCAKQGETCNPTTGQCEQIRLNKCTSNGCDIKDAKQCSITGIPQICDLNTQLNCLEWKDRQACLSTEICDIIKGECIIEDSDDPAALVVSTITGNSILDDIKYTFNDIIKFFKSLFSLKARGTEITYNFEIYRNANVLPITIYSDDAKYCDKENNNYICAYEDTSDLESGDYVYKIKIYDKDRTESKDSNELTVEIEEDNNCTANICNPTNNKQICKSDGTGYESCPNNQVCSNNACIADTAAPLINLISVGGDANPPYETTDSTPDIIFTTDENANCKISLTDQGYDAMGNDCLTGEGTTSHTCISPGLGSVGDKNIYLACKDSSDNKHTSLNNKDISLTLKSTLLDTLPPDVSVSLNISTNPLIKQLFKINVTADDSNKGNSGISEIKIYLDNLDNIPIKTCNTFEEISPKYTCESDELKYNSIGSHTYYATAKDNSPTKNEGRNPLKETKSLEVTRQLILSCKPGELKSGTECLYCNKEGYAFEINNKACLSKICKSDGTCLQINLDNKNNLQQCQDIDEDGYTDSLCGGNDCDDLDSETNPDVIEICNDLLDNNCDTLIDLDDPACIIEKKSDIKPNVRENLQNNQELQNQPQTKNTQDSDNDGLLDDWELAYFGDLKAQSGNDDFDEDEINNLEEFKQKTNPKVSDLKEDNTLLIIISSLIIIGIISLPIILIIKKINKKKLIKLEAQFTKPEHKQLYDYIKEARTQNISDERIKINLINADWPKEDIEYVLNIKL